MHRTKYRKERSNKENTRETREKAKRSSFDETDARVTNVRNKPIKVIDTSLLARGMTARSVGFRVANNLKVLAANDIERDIRHMEAYGAACVSYAQQLFAFSNRDLVERGHYGPAPPAPGMSFTRNDSNGHSQPSVMMPVRIDPEEEKRLAILRKRVAASEAKREVLETEYLSLRAHYVHESHKLRRTRSAVTGQLKMLRELIKRRGEVLALRRVKCAVAREILACLNHRANSSEAAVSNANGTSEAMEGVKATADTKEDEKMTGEESKKSAKVPADLVDVWALIDSKLHEAEVACTDIATPEELLYIKNALCADATALEAASEAAAAEKNRRSRSPSRFNEEEDEATEKETGKKKKSRSERATRRGIGGGSLTGFSGKKAEIDKDDNVVPWSCRTLPRTPHGVSIYLSNLSTSPELAAAFACDSMFGSKPESLAWLESNLPVSTKPGAQEDSNKLAKIKDDIKLLQAELDKEIKQNSKFQRDAIEGRKQMDEICAMISIIRSETEAVVHRHNQILEANDMLNEENNGNDDGTEVAEDDDGQGAFGGENFGEVAQPVPEVIVASENDDTMKRELTDGDTDGESDRKRRKV